MNSNYIYQTPPSSARKNLDYQPKGLDENREAKKTKRKNINHQKNDPINRKIDFGSNFDIFQHHEAPKSIKKADQIIFEKDINQEPSQYPRCCLDR